MSVAVNEPKYSHGQELKDLAPHRLREIEHFFLTYKNLEAKDVHSDGWVGREEAMTIINQAVVAYRH